MCLVSTLCYDNLHTPLQFGVQISMNTPSIILFTTENKKASLTDGAEREIIITEIWCWKAVGSFIPSRLKLVRKGMYERLLDELVEDPKRVV